MVRGEEDPSPSLDITLSALALGGGSLGLGEPGVPGATTGGGTGDGGTGDTGEAATTGDAFGGIGLLDISRLLFTPYFCSVTVVNFRDLATESDSLTFFDPLLLQLLKLCPHFFVM